MADYPNVDGVVPFVHEIGCGMEMTGEPMDLLRRTLSGFIRNPNITAAVVMALGCERNNLKSFLEQEKLAVGPKLRTVTIQESGGIRNAVEDAKRIVYEMLPEANNVKRTACLGGAPPGGPAIRRRGCVLRALGRPSPGGGGRHPRPQRRNRHPVPDPGALRGRACSCGPRSLPGGWPKVR